MAAVNGTSVYYAQFGEGPPVLLLHGGLANSDYWGLQVGELAKEFPFSSWIRAATVEVR
jgi:pimeloyl-ACP methyl ester carboxylesterase